MQGSKPQITAKHVELFEKMTLDELKEEKRAALSLIKFTSSSFMKEQVRMELGLIERCISDIYQVMYK